MNIIWKILSSLLSMAFAIATIVACTSEPAAKPQASSKKEKSKDDDDDDDDDGDDDSDDDDSSDDDDDDDDDAKECNKSGLEEGADLRLTTMATVATVTWVNSIKSYLSSQGCTSCHNGTDAADFNRYASASKMVMETTDDAYANEPEHASLGAAKLDAAKNKLIEWHFSYYARGSGFSEFEVESGAEYADLHQSYTDAIRLKLEDACTVCHNKFTENVPFSTGLDFLDFTVVANTAEKIIERLNDADKPMPPKGSNIYAPTLASGDKTAIIDWINANKSALAEIELRSGSSTEAKDPCSE